MCMKSSEQHKTNQNHLDLSIWRGTSLNSGNCPVDLQILDDLGSGFGECFCVVLWLPFCTRAMNEPGSQKIYIGL